MEWNTHTSIVPQYKYLPPLTNNLPHPFPKRPGMRNQLVLQIKHGHFRYLLVRVYPVRGNQVPDGSGSGGGRWSEGRCDDDEVVQVGPDERFTACENQR